MDSDVLILQHVTHLALRRIEHPAVPTSASLTRNIRIVDRRRDADRCCGSTEKIAHVVRDAVEEIRSVIEASRQILLLENLVDENEVMCWAGCSVEGRMRLKKKIPVALLVDDYGVNDLMSELAFQLCKDGSKRL